MGNNLKQRNGCITAWLWVVILANMAMAIFYAVSMFEVYSTEMALGFGICSIFGIVNILGAILLMRWNKMGFYLFLFSSLIATVVNVCVLKMSPVTAVSSLFAIIIWWAVLQAKKDGKSAWSQLQSGWDYKHCRHLYQVFTVFGIITFVLTLVAVGGAHKDSYEAVAPYLDEDTMAVVEPVQEVVVDSVAVEEDAVVAEEPIKPQPKKERPVKEDGEAPVVSVQSNDSEDSDKHVRFLKIAIKECDDALPQKVEEGMIMKRCYLEGDYVMYLFECDEDLYDMDLLEAGKSDMKQSLKETYTQSSDPQIAYFVKLCVKAHKGLGFIYQGNTTGKSCIVRLSYSELNNL